MELPPSRSARCKASPMARKNGVSSLKFSYRLNAWAMSENKVVGGQETDRLEERLDQPLPGPGESVLEQAERSLATDEHLLGKGRQLRAKGELPPRPGIFRRG